MKNSILAIAAMAVTSMLFTGCERHHHGENGSLNVEFEHLWGMNQLPFSIGTQYVHPMTGDTMTFTTLKYYISNVELTKEDGTVQFVPNSYYLVDASNPLSAMLSLDSIPSGHYTGISFLVGVDSTRNVSGAQTGALDPANDMFWSWNSGYVFIKAEGTSPQSTMPNAIFKFHIGGFQGANSGLNRASMSFGGGMAVVQEGASPVVHLAVNPAMLWCANGVCFPGLAQESHLMMPNAATAQRAKAFSEGFSFEHLHN